ncbi:MAG: hypothetical protein ACTSRI_00340 [Promethearchaeota archaeon]
MNLKNWRQWAYILNMIGCIQFIFFTFIGMLFYAGGTYIDPTIPGYSFFSNYFSDIGRTVAYSGEPNTVSFICFSIAFFMVGVLLIPSFLAFPHFFRESSIKKLISIFGTIIGIFTTFCLSGISFAPSDVNGSAHGWFVLAGFSSGFFVSLIYSLVIFLNKDYPRRYGLNFLFFTASLGVYLILLFFGPSSKSVEGLIINVTGQKFILYIFATCLFFHGWGAWKQESKS